MSVDPHGILYYGIDLGGEARSRFRTESYDYDAINSDWEESHQPNKPDSPSDNYRGPEWDAWRKKLREWEASAENVAIRWYGSDDCQRFVAHCVPLEKRVEYDEQIDLGLCTPGHCCFPHNQDADRWLRVFCEKYQIPYKQPTWHLACLYF